MQKINNLKLSILFPLFFLGFLIQVYGQGTQASIAGSIKDEAGHPVSEATIRIRNASTGFTTSTISNEHGNFEIRQLPLGGPYTVVAEHLSKGKGSATGIMLNQGDVARISIAMVSKSNEIEAVEIKGNALKNSKDYFGAATAFSYKQITSLPVNGRNFSSLTDLSPLASGASIAGQLGSSTNFTIDGMTAKNPTSSGPTTSRSGAPYSMSMEAVREFKVVTNQYDVTFGRSGGGIVSAATKSGTNTTTGSAFVFGRASWLASKYDIHGNKRLGDYSTYQFGFSLGGPIIKDKLHYFVVWDRQQDNRSLFVADVRTNADALFYKISKDQLDKYIDIAQDKYGVAKQAQTGTIPKKRTSDVGFLRLDYQINEKNLLTIRDNLTHDYNPMGLSDNVAITLKESYGNDKNFDNSFLATLRTAISPRITNELKVQHLYVYQNSTQNDLIGKNYIPRAVVEGIQSNIDGTTLSTDIQLGGQRYGQEGFKNNVIQMTDNLYYDTEWAKYTFGMDVMSTISNSRYGSEVNGRFFYSADQNGNPPTSAMDNFENLKPYRFYREVPLKDNISVHGTIMNYGLYGQMRKNLGLGVEMTAGLRMDYATYPRANFNQLVYDELKLRTDNPLKTFIVQPRLQFTWDINENQTDYLRAGAGIFASDLNNYMLINNLTFDGTNLATVDVRGDQVPTPDFNAYRKDPNTIPTLKQYQVPTINFTGKDAKVPTVYKTNLSYTKLIHDKLRLGLTGYMTLGRHNYTYIDRNMVENPFFHLVDEANRGVFVPADKIPSNGAPDWKDGRISDKLGRVLELTSLSKVNQFAFVVDGSYQYYKDGVISGSYTWNSTKDNTSFNGNVANGATTDLPVTDDPRNLSAMTYSDNQFRHKVVLYGTAPSFYGFQFSFRFSGFAGTRYTLNSGGNTNGDFVSADNDLAYIFNINDPNTPANVREGLQAILNNPNAAQSMKDILNKYAGKIAPRNAGVNGFFGTLDVHLSKGLRIYKTQKVDLSIDVFNLVNMFDKNKGINRLMGNQSLYKVTGFDQNNKAFTYNVNSVGTKGLSGNPFQAQFGVRYSF